MFVNCWSVYEDISDGHTARLCFPFSSTLSYTANTVQHILTGTKDVFKCISPQWTPGCKSTALPGD